MAYRLLIDLMSYRSEILVQLAAIKSLKQCVEDFDFEEEAFGPYLEAAVPLLATSLQSLHEFSSRQIVLGSLTAIVNRMDSKMKPFAGVLVGLLAPLWEYSASQEVLKVSIIDLAVKLTEAIRGDSEILRGFSIPVITFSLREGALYIEDSLELWMATMKHARTLTPDLFGLFPLLCPIFETEHTRQALEILNSYVLIGGAPFMNHYGTVVKGVFESLFQAENLATPAVAVITKVMDTILRSFPAEGHTLLVVPLTKMAMAILADKDQSSVTLAAYLSIFARVLLNDPAFFMQFLGSGTQDLRLAFIDKWIDKVDSIGQPSQRKLTAFAICSLIKTTDDQILNLLPGIINVCLNVYFQLEQPAGELDGFERDE